MKKIYKILIGCSMMAVTLVESGCGKDSNTVVVDFDKTIAVERPSSQVPDTAALNVAVAAMISPKETFVYYRELLDYIGNNMGREVRLIQRKTYAEVSELFQKGQIDLAFICSGPYAISREKFGFEALATPLVREKPFYQSYLIVNKASTYQQLADLRGKIFAFTDPDSNTGALVPNFWLSRMGETPESYFGSFTYTYSHDNSIMAVARTLVDGAAVDGHKWEYYHAQNPIYTSRTRIIKKSEPFGSPPLVASVALPPRDKEHIRQAVFSMHLDSKGKKILEKLMIDRFVAPKEEWYEPIRQMKQTLGAPESLPHEAKKS